MTLKDTEKRHNCLMHREYELATRSSIGAQRKLQEEIRVYQEVILRTAKSFSLVIAGRSGSGYRL